MKSKISKILGVVVTLSIIASLMVAATALPASAAPTALAYSAVSAPSRIGNVLGCTTFAAATNDTPQTDFLAGNSDGSILFAWDLTNATLFKSTNFGASWAAVGNPALATGWGGTPVALLVSPTVAVDKTVVVVTSLHVFVSGDSGASFTKIADPDLETTSTILSADLGVYYADGPSGPLSILVGLSAGTAAGTGATSNVEKFKLAIGSYGWTPIGGLETIGACSAAVAGGAAATSMGGTALGVYKLVSGPNLINVTAVGGGNITFTLAAGVTGTLSGCGFAAGTAITGAAQAIPGAVGILTATLTETAGTDVGDMSVEGVKFSPNHLSDSEIIIVANNAAGTAVGVPMVYSSLAGQNFNTTYGCPLTTTGGTWTIPLIAKIAMGTDYNGLNSGNTIAVGTSGGTYADDLYRVSGRGSASAGTAVAAGFATSIKSIAISAAPIATATVLVGTTTSANVQRCSAFTAATLAFSAATKAPTGATSCSVLWAGTTAIAGTMGNDSAISASTDGAVNFYGLSLCNVGTLTNLKLTATGTALTVVDNNNMFLIMINSNGGYAGQQLWATTDGGATWKRIAITNGVSGMTVIASVTASPAFATDKTIWVSQGTTAAFTTIFKSTDGGNSFTPALGYAKQGVILAIDGTNYYYGGAAAGVFYKSGNAIPATFTGGAGGSVTSIDTNPKDATNIAVGLSDGTVWNSTDSGSTFAKLGTTGVAAPVLVTFGPDGSLYADGTTTVGITRWVSATSSFLPLLTVINTFAPAAGTGLAVGTDGTLYATDSTAAYDMVRSLNPTLGDAVSVATCEFQQLDNTNGKFGGIVTPASAKFTGLSVVSTATNNIAYTINADTAGTNTVTGSGYVGVILAFNDTFIGAPAQSSPADKAQITATNDATVSWAAVTGATNYAVLFNSASDFSGTATPNTVTGTSATNTTGGALTPGNTYYWKVRATSQVIGGATVNLYSRWSTVRSFITTISAPGYGVTQALVPAMGGTAVAVDTTFAWPVVTGATSYDFVIAEDQGNANHFAIIDFGDSTSVNAYKLKEALKYNTAYWWEVRANSGTSTGNWTIGYFTTAPAPTSTTTTSTAAVTPTVIVTAPTQPPATYTIVNSGTTGTTTPVIPTYLLWLVIVVGAVLVIAVIVLIVRTRRIS
jgi:hypothetical protein